MEISDTGPLTLTFYIESTDNLKTTIRQTKAAWLNFKIEILKPPTGWRFKKDVYEALELNKQQMASLLKALDLTWDDILC